MSGSSNGDDARDERRRTRVRLHRYVPRVARLRTPLPPLHSGSSRAFRSRLTAKLVPALPGLTELENPFQVPWVVPVGSPTTALESDHQEKDCISNHWEYASFDESTAFDLEMDKELETSLPLKEKEETRMMENQSNSKEDNERNSDSLLLEELKRVLREIADRSQTPDVADDGKSALSRGFSRQASGRLSFDGHRSDVVSVRQRRKRETARSVRSRRVRHVNHTPADPEPNLDQAKKPESEVWKKLENAILASEIALEKAHIEGRRCPEIAELSEHETPTHEMRQAKSILIQRGASMETLESRQKGTVRFAESAVLYKVDPAYSVASFNAAIEDSLIPPHGMSSRTSSDGDGDSSCNLESSSSSDVSVKCERIHVKTKDEESECSVYFLTPTSSITRFPSGHVNRDFSKTPTLDKEHDFQNQAEELQCREKEIDAESASVRQMQKDEEDSDERLANDLADFEENLSREKIDFCFFTEQSNKETAPVPPEPLKEASSLPLAKSASPTSTLKSLFSTLCLVRGWKLHAEGSLPRFEQFYARPSQSPESPLCERPKSAPPQLVAEPEIDAEVLNSFHQQQLPATIEAPDQEIAAEVTNNDEEDIIERQSSTENQVEAAKCEVVVDASEFMTSVVPRMETSMSEPVSDPREEEEEEEDAAPPMSGGTTSTQTSQDNLQSNDRASISVQTSPSGLGVQTPVLRPIENSKMAPKERALALVDQLDNKLNALFSNKALTTTALSLDTAGPSAEDVSCQHPTRSFTFARERKVGTKHCGKYDMRSTPKRKLSSHLNKPKREPTIRSGHRECLSFSKEQEASVKTVRTSSKPSTELSPKLRDLCRKRSSGRPFDRDLIKGRASRSSSGVRPPFGIIPEKGQTTSLQNTIRATPMETLFDPADVATRIAIDRIPMSSYFASALNATKSDLARGSIALDSCLSSHIASLINEQDDLSWESAALKNGDIEETVSSKESLLETVTNILKIDVCESVELEKTNKSIEEAFNFIYAFPGSTRANVALNYESLKRSLSNAEEKQRQRFCDNTVTPDVRNKQPQEISKTLQPGKLPLQMKHVSITCEERLRAVQNSKELPSKLKPRKKVNDNKKRNIKVEDCSHSMKLNPESLLAMVRRKAKDDEILIPKFSSKIRPIETTRQRTDNAEKPYRSWTNKHLYHPIKLQSCPEFSAVLTNSFESLQERKDWNDRLEKTLSEAKGTIASVTQVISLASASIAKAERTISAVIKEKVKQTTCAS